MTENELLNLLEEQGIPFHRVEHEAVFTVSQAEKIDQKLKGLGTKNLFLRDKKGKAFFLVVVEQSKRADLKALAKTMQSDRFSFASPERMREMLGVEPGSATIMAILNDTENLVSLYLDRDVWEASHISCHPLVNTATLQLSQEGLRSFLKFSGKDFKIIDIPVQAEREP